MHNSHRIRYLHCTAENILLPVSKDGTVSFGQLKCDRKVTKIWLNGWH